MHVVSLHVQTTKLLSHQDVVVRNNIRQGILPVGFIGENDFILVVERHITLALLVEAVGGFPRISGLNGYILKHLCVQNCLHRDG